MLTTGALCLKLRDVILVYHFYPLVETRELVTFSNKPLCTARKLDCHQMTFAPLHPIQLSAERPF